MVTIIQLSSIALTSGRRRWWELLRLHHLRGCSYCNCCWSFCCQQWGRDNVFPVLSLTFSKDTLLFVVFSFPLSTFHIDYIVSYLGAWVAMTFHHYKNPFQGLDPCFHRRLHKDACPWIRWALWHNRCLKFSFTKRNIYTFLFYISFREYFCEMYPTFVSYKLCEFIAV